MAASMKRQQKFKIGKQEASRRTKEGKKKKKIVLTRFSYSKAGRPRHVPDIVDAPIMV